MGAKKGYEIWILLFIGVLILLPVLQQVAMNYTGSYLPWGDKKDKPDITPGDVPVFRKLEITFLDSFGTATPSGTGYVYTANGQLKDSASLSSGVYTTSTRFNSGDEIYILWDDGSNDMMWYKTTVPYMAEADIDSQTNNPMDLGAFVLATYTTKATDQAGTQISDAGNYNHTASGSQATFSVSFWVGTDNQGYIASECKDPLNDMHWKAVLYLKVFGTNYEYIDVTGFDYSWSRGTANWYATEIDSTELTKWKVGTTYVYDGACTFTHSADFTGYTGTAADLQYYLYFYSDPSYMIDHGSAGPDSYEAAELTINAQT